MPSCTPREDVGASGEDDHLVKDAADLEAVAHVADRHVIAVDHAGPFGA